MNRIAEASAGRFANNSVESVRTDLRGRVHGDSKLFY